MRRCSAGHGGAQRGLDAGRRRRRNTAVEYGEGGRSGLHAHLAGVGHGRAKLDDPLAHCVTQCVMVGGWPDGGGTKGATSDDSRVL